MKEGTAVEVLYRLGGRWEAATVVRTFTLPDGSEAIEARLTDRPMTQYAGLLHESKRKTFCWRKSK